KHRVSVLRAMRRVTDRDPSLQLTRHQFSGPPEVVLFRAVPRPRPVGEVNEQIWAWRFEERGVAWYEATIVRLTKTRVTILVDGREVIADRDDLRPILRRKRFEDLEWTFVRERD